MVVLVHVRIKYGCPKPENRLSPSLRGEHEQALEYSGILNRLLAFLRNDLKYT